MGRYSDGTSEHEKCFEGSRRRVYKEKLLVLDDFLSICLYSFPWIVKQTRLGTSSDSCLVPISAMQTLSLCPDLDMKFKLPISRTPDPACDSCRGGVVGV